MNPCLFYLTLLTSSISAQWNSFQQSWPTHPPQTAPHTAQHQTHWNNPSGQWNNHMAWGPNTGHSMWNMPRPAIPKTTLLVPTTTPEPPDSPPQKVVIVHTNQQPGSAWQTPQSQNPGWFPPGSNRFTSGWGNTPGQQPGSWGGPMTNNVPPPWGQSSQMNPSLGTWGNGGPQQMAQQQSMIPQQTAAWGRHWGQNINQQGWNPMQRRMTQNRPSWNQLRHNPKSFQRPNTGNHRQPPPQRPMMPRHDTAHPNQHPPETHHQHPEPQHQVPPNHMTEPVPYHDPSHREHHQQPPAHAPPQNNPRQDSHAEVPPQDPYNHDPHRPPPDAHYQPPEAPTSATGSPHDRHARPEGPNHTPYREEQPHLNNRGQHPQHSDPASHTPKDSRSPHQPHPDKHYPNQPRREPPVQPRAPYPHDSHQPHPHEVQPPNQPHQAPRSHDTYRPHERSHQPEHLAYTNASKYGPQGHHDPAYRHPKEHHSETHHSMPSSRTTTIPPPSYDQYVQSQLGPPAMVTSDPTIRVHNYLADASHVHNNPPVWPDTHKSQPVHHEPPVVHRPPNPEPVAEGHRPPNHAPPAYEHGPPNQPPPGHEHGPPNHPPPAYEYDPPNQPPPGHKHGPQHHPPPAYEHGPPNQPSPGHEHGPSYHQPPVPVHGSQHGPPHLPAHGPPHGPPPVLTHGPPNGPPPVLTHGAPNGPPPVVVHGPPNQHQVNGLPPAQIHGPHDHQQPTLVHGPPYQHHPVAGTNQPPHHLPSIAVAQTTPSTPTTAVPITVTMTTVFPLESLMHIDPVILAALTPEEIMMLANMVRNPSTPSTLPPPVQTTQNTSKAVLTPPTMKYGVTHPDGFVTEEVYSLVASRVQRIVSLTTSLFKRMTAYILFDRNRGTFALRSKFVRDICYAGFLDDDVTKSFKDIVNKTTLVAVPHITGNDKIFFYKEEEQILFSDALREAGLYVAGSCGKDSFMFRVSRVRNPDTHVGTKVIPGDACPYGPPYRHGFYNIARCQNGTCPTSYTCNAKYDVCCPDMPPSTQCFPFSLGKICVHYMPGRRIVD